MSQRESVKTTSPAAAGLAPTDLLDERLVRPESLGDYLMLGWKRLRTGDLGSGTVLIGLALIWTIFQIVNPVFLSPTNLANLLVQSAPIGVMALGMINVLLVGEIDLSVGSVSGLSAAVVAVTSVNRGWPIAVAILLSLALGAAIGAFYATIYNRFGVPAFIITVAGLLAFLGLQLFVLGKDGTINLPYDSFLVWFGQAAYAPELVSYGIVLAAGAAVLLSKLRWAQKRRAAQLSAVPTSVTVLGVGSVALVVLFVVWYLNRARGVSWMFLFFLSLVAMMHYLYTRTKWGRSVFAVGGNREAARRAGIKVGRVYASVFILCSTFGALGGLMAAGRLAAAAQSSGTGDTNLNAIAAAVIGGTSMFGGRGSAFAAVLGIIVIQSIASGLTLMNLESSFRFMVTGAVLLIAVILDSVSRKNRIQSGRI